MDRAERVPRQVLRTGKLGGVLRRVAGTHDRLHTSWRRAAAICAAARGGGGAVHAEHLLGGAVAANRCEKMPPLSRAVRDVPRGFAHRLVRCIRLREREQLARMPQRRAQSRGVELAAAGAHQHIKDAVPRLRKMRVVAAHIKLLLQREAAVVSAAQELYELRRALQARHILKHEHAAAPRAHGDLEHVIEVLNPERGLPSAGSGVARAGWAAGENLRVQTQHVLDELGARLRQRHVALPRLRVGVVGAVDVEGALLEIHCKLDVDVTAQALGEAADAAVDLDGARARRALALLQVVRGGATQRDSLAEHGAAGQVDGCVGALLQKDGFGVDAGSYFCASNGGAVRGVDNDLH